ncbi:hypothetical protein [Brevibacillus borstelensis]|uniref:hypothetical protein n=1 Tax=Brevibacillus borstelensis TaxID=45462 RepID=UPI0030BF0F9D
MSNARLCPNCSKETSSQALTCDLCGEMLKSRPPETPPVYRSDDGKQSPANKASTFKLTPIVYITIVINGMFILFLYKALSALLVQVFLATTAILLFGVIKGTLYFFPLDNRKNVGLLLMASVIFLCTTAFLTVVYGTNNYQPAH